MLICRQTVNFFIYKMDMKEFLADKLPNRAMVSGAQQGSFPDMNIWTMQHTLEPYELPKQLKSYVQSHHTVSKNSDNYFITSI